MTRKDAIARAALWYAQHRDECPRPIVPELRERFGLRPAEAIRALQAAQNIRRAAA